MIVSTRYPEIAAAPSPQRAAKAESTPLTASPSATVSLSSAGTDLLAQPLLLPTRENAAKLAQEAAQRLNAKLDEAGIPRDPPFELDIEDINSAHVSVKGGRPDATAIEALVNGDRELQMGLHNAEAIASSIPAFERAVAYSEAYQAARTQQQINLVNARFADLLNGNTRPAEVAMRYGEGGIKMRIDGQPI